MLSEIISFIRIIDAFTIALETLLEEKHSETTQISIAIALLMKSILEYLESIREYPGMSDATEIRSLTHLTKSDFWLSNPLNNPPKGLKRTMLEAGILAALREIRESAIKEKDALLEQ